MMNQGPMTYPAFDTLADLLLMAGFPFSPSWIHGVMSGLLCVDQRPTTVSWESFETEMPFLGESDSPINKSFKKLFSLTAAALQEQESVLLPITPLDDEPVVERLDALIQWCEGFLAGLEWVEEAEEMMTRSSIASEIIQDFSKIQEFSDEVVESEEYEKYYAEIFEFVRVGVLLIRAECRSLFRVPHSAECACPHQIH